MFSALRVDTVVRSASPFSLATVRRFSLVGNGKLIPSRQTPLSLLTRDGTNSRNIIHGGYPPSISHQVRHFRPRDSHPHIRMPDAMVDLAWEEIKTKMVNHFKEQRISRQDTSVEIDAYVRDKFSTDGSLLEEELIPGLITGHGEDIRIVLKKKDIDPIAFDEIDGHLSFLFKARLFFLRVHESQVDGTYGKSDTHPEENTECCYVPHVRTDTVSKDVYNIIFQRAPLGHIYEVDVPLRLTNIQQSPSFKMGFQVELAMPAIRVQVNGPNIPPPFVVNAAKIDYRSERNRHAYVSSLTDQLPENGMARFHPGYTVLDNNGRYSHETRVAIGYAKGMRRRVPMPPGEQDFNLVTKTGFARMVSKRVEFPHDTVKQRRKKMAPILKHGLGAAKDTK